jgi:hypothetical protein
VLNDGRIDYLDAPFWFATSIGISVQYMTMTMPECVGTEKAICAKGRRGTAGSQVLHTTQAWVSSGQDLGMV